MSNKINHIGGKCHNIKPLESKCYKVKHMIIPYFKGILKVVFAIFPEFSH